MELLDDECHMQSRFVLFGESVSFGARQVHGLCLLHHRLRNHFGKIRWYSQVKGLKWKPGLVCMEIMIILIQDRMHGLHWNIPYAQKSIWTHLMELLDDVCHMKSRFGLFGDSVSFDARQVQGLCLMHHRLRNNFGRTRWYSQVKRLKWKLCLVYSEIVLILIQDIQVHSLHGPYHMLGINLDAPDGTPR